MKKFFIIVCLLFCGLSLCAQQTDFDSVDSHIDWGEDIQYKAQFEASVSNSKTPLWLHSNKNGLSSIEKNNAMLRLSAIKPLEIDDEKPFGVGYGIDIAAAYHHTNKLILQQAFIEARWKAIALTAGSKEFGMELKNNELSSGSQTLGINARPVPQVRLSLPNYWVLPFTNGWLRVKGHVGYGMMTDGNWQKQLTQGKHKHVEKGLYHSKAGYLMIGNPDAFYPFSLEMGLEMATLFGGTTYGISADGTQLVVKNQTSLRSFWNAFIPGGNEVIEQDIVYKNVEGDQLGSWVIRMNYEADDWKLGIYADKFFEDHSSMLQLDYDGYGTGENWDVREHRKYFMYNFKDMLLGLEINLKRDVLIENIVFEYFYSKYQSGPVYHDHTPNMSTHISGIDNFYNHHIYPGWQHWGEVIGNPLYLSPIYNEDGSIEVKNNRSKAFHLGVMGRINNPITYRLLATYQQGFGTYYVPYTAMRQQFYLLTEANYLFENGWQISGRYGIDLGKITGNNFGFQLSVSKTGVFNFKKRK